MYKKYLSILLVIPLFFAVASSASAYSVSQSGTSVTINTTVADFEYCNSLGAVRYMYYFIADGPNSYMTNVDIHKDNLPLDWQYDNVPEFTYTSVRMRCLTNGGGLLGTYFGLTGFTVPYVAPTPTPTPTPLPTPTPTPSVTPYIATVISDTGTTLKNNVVGGLQTGAPILAGTSVLFWAFNFISRKIKGSAR
jgi:hypothetical protein